MANNLRLFYAVVQAGIAKAGENTFTSIHGLQSVGIDTQFNLEQIFELGQLALYQNVENIPDISVTAEKVLDGYPLIYHLATKGSTSPSLSGRSNAKATLGLSVYSDVQDSASGTPLKQCTVSGVFVQSLAYRFQVNGNSTESVTLVGNNKIWSNTFTATAFDNTDEPNAPEGVNRRQHFILGETNSPVTSRLPSEIPGVTASGTVPFANGQFEVHIQSVGVQTNLGREQLFELGRRGPYHRYVTFPIEVRTDIEVYCLEGDDITALEDDESNLSDHEIILRSEEGIVIDLGIKNKLSSVSFGGLTAGQGGGNATCTYSYSNFNDMSVTHPEDPSGL